MAAYRPAAVALGATLIAGAVSNALLSTLTSWTAERFAARLKARLFTKIVSSDQAGVLVHPKTLHIVCSVLFCCPVYNNLHSLCPHCPFMPEGCCLVFAVSLLSDA